MQLHSPRKLFPDNFEINWSLHQWVDVVGSWDPVFLELFPEASFLFADLSNQIQKSSPHKGLNFHQFTTLCWDLQIKTLPLEILLKTLYLSSSQHLPTDERPVGLEFIWNIISSVSAVAVSNLIDYKNR